MTLLQFSDSDTISDYHCTNLPSKINPLVRDLTITRSGEGYIMGDDSIMQLDPADFHVKKSLEFDSILWCSDNQMHLSAKQGGKKFELKFTGGWPIKYSISEDTGSTGVPLIEC